MVSGKPGAVQFDYFGNDHLRNDPALCTDGCNNARRLKTLEGRTTAQFICKEWQAAPNPFIQEHCQVKPYNILASNEISMPWHKYTLELDAVLDLNLGQGQRIQLLPVEVVANAGLVTYR